MRINAVHVTIHAEERWHLRVSKNSDISEIVDFVKKSTIIKKNQLLPYGLPRMPNTVYSKINDIVFIMQPVSIDEYILITIISGNDSFKIAFPRKIEPRQKRILNKKQKRIKNYNDPFVNYEKRNVRRKIAELKFLSCD